MAASPGPPSIPPNAYALCVVTGAMAESCGNSQSSGADHIILSSKAEDDRSCQVQFAKEFEHIFYEPTPKNSDEFLGARVDSSNTGMSTAVIHSCDLHAGRVDSSNTGMSTAVIHSCDLHAGRVDSGADAAAIARLFDEFAPYFKELPEQQLLASNTELFLQYQQCMTARPSLVASPITAISYLCATPRGHVSEGTLVSSTASCVASQEPGQQFEFVQAHDVSDSLLELQSRLFDTNGGLKVCCVCQTVRVLQAASTHQQVPCH